MAQVPELLTAAEIGAAWKVDAATVRRWAANGQIDHEKTPTGGLRFPPSALPEAVRAADPLTAASASP